MRVEITIDQKIKETFIKIFARQMNKEVEMIQRLLTTEHTHIIGQQGDEAVLLEPIRIIRIYTEDKKVFAQCQEREYQLKLRIYELEQLLYHENFIKISQGELVNLAYVKRLDFSFKGTIALELKSGSVSYVSRRYLSNFKKALNL